MNAYQVGWMLACSLVPIIGVSITFLLSPVALAILWVVFGGSSSIATAAMRSQHRTHASHRRWPSAAQMEASIAAFAHATPEHLPAISAATDDQLFRRWRTSYLDLQGRVSVHDVLALAGQRQRYLDEFERRNPTGFAAWLISGPLASSNPLLYLANDRADGLPIDWDDFARERD